MKTKLFSALAVSMLLIACEPEILDDTTFDPAPVDTTYSGFNLSINSNASFSSRGYGFVEPDSNGYFWGLATGNSLQYDPVDKVIYSTSATDTVLLVSWSSQSPVAGVYSPDSTHLAMYSDPSGAKYYDASQLSINIVSVTTDSIFGTYQGNLNEVIPIFDTVNMTFTVVPTGVVDVVSASFGVERAQ